MNPLRTAATDAALPDGDHVPLAWLQPMCDAVATSLGLHEGMNSMMYDTSELKAACARITCADRRGTGFLITPDTILTCAHVVGTGIEVDVEFIPQGKLLGYVEQIDEVNDIALIKLKESMTNIRPLPLEINLDSSNRCSFEAYGFPSATENAGFLLRGEVQDVAGQDLRGRHALVLYSPNVTAGAHLQGFSGAPVWRTGRVIGQLRQVIPDVKSGAQYGVVYACPASYMARFSSYNITKPRPLLRAPGGSYDAGVYVSRPHDEKQAHSYLCTAGKPAILWGPERFGKTWLIERLLENWQITYPQGRVARLNLNEFSTDDFKTYSKFLYQLSYQVAEQILGSTQLLLNEWTEDRTPNFRIKEVMRSVLQKSGCSISEPMVIVLDNADALIPYNEIMVDFFKILRSWADEKKPPWPTLRILLAVSISPSRLTQGVQSSPFENLSDPILLEPMNLEQIGVLAETYGLEWQQRERLRLHDWVGGHPYLVSVLLHEAALENAPLDRLIADPPVPIEQHLKRRRELLIKNSNFADALRKIIACGTCLIEDDVCREALFQAGLIERVRGDQRKRDHYRLRGEIYKEILP